jgi:flagella basal body P-ring formation protein FlgA
MRNMFLLCLWLASAPAAAASGTVMAETVERGAIITAADLASGDIPADVRTALAATDIIGKQATRRLDAGRFVRAIDVRVPAMVERGSAVTLVVAQPGLEITAPGRALQPGGRGEVIRVEALATHVMIDGEVIAPGRVRVIAGSRPTQSTARRR